MALAALNARKIYPPVGYCIYCNRSAPPLTDEHIFPDGMGGRQVLPKASCETCQKIINEEVEQYCQRVLLGNLRAHLGIKSAKRRPRPSPSIRVKGRDGLVKNVHMKPNDIPVFAHLPVFPVPAIMYGDDLPEAFQPNWWVYESRDLPGTLESLNAVQIVSPNVDIAKIARFIAKIAHSTAAAALDPAVFNPFLPSIILGEDKRFIKYVGASYDTIISDDAPIVSIFPVQRNSDRKMFVVAEVRLFSRIKGPVYLAVVGEIIGEWRERSGLHV